MRHVNLTIEGNVQGVGFRWQTRSTARRLGVCGYVRNEPDGSVRVEAEAADSILEQFLRWCRHGPTGATVTVVHVEDGTFQGFSEFEIRF